jgi:hypothetical protein
MKSTRNSAALTLQELDQEVQGLTALIVDNIRRARAADRHQFIIHAVEREGSTHTGCLASLAFGYAILQLTEELGHTTELVADTWDGYKACLMTSQLEVARDFLGGRFLATAVMTNPSPVVSDLGQLGYLLALREVVAQAIPTL